jgi:glycosyltransferase involved in cell wall biosynthesis
MPCFNTRETIARTVAAVQTSCEPDVIIAVDDGSKDDSAAVAKASGCHVISHNSNRGYGGAQKTGYRFAIENNADIVVLVHGDNQYDPSLAGEFVRKVASGYPVVTGTRMVLGDALASGMPWWKYAANRVLTGLENVSFGTQLTDFHNGFRAYSKSFLQSVPFDRFSEKFDFDTDIILHAALRRVPIAEIPHTTRYREENSQMSFWNGVKYGTRILGTVARFHAHRLGFRHEPLFDLEN